MDNRNTDLASVLARVKASDRTAHSRALLIRDTPAGPWVLRYLATLVGQKPPGWQEQAWIYPRVALVAWTSSGSELTPLLVEDPDQILRIGDADVAVPRVSPQVAQVVKPSFHRFDRPTLPWPAVDSQLSASDTSALQAMTQGISEMLVASSCPSFPNFDSAYRAFFEDDFSAFGSQRLPSHLADVQEVEERAWLGPIHIGPTNMTVQLEGMEVAGCELELFGVSNRTNVQVSEAGTITIDLPDGLPDNAWLWLKNSSGWLDYRVLDPTSGWNPQGRGGARGIEVDMPVDPNTAIEAMLAAGEGPQMEYKRELPQDTKAARKALKTVAAFATQDGGTIIFGIDPDETTVVGLAENPGGVRDRLTDLVRASVFPTPHFEATTHDVRGRVVLVLRVEASPSPPYALVSDKGTANMPEFYVRRGATTFHAQPHDLREATLRRVHETSGGVPEGSAGSLQLWAGFR